MINTKVEISHEEDDEINSVVIRLHFTPEETYDRVFTMLDGAVKWVKESV